MHLEFVFSFMVESFKTDFAFSKNVKILFDKIDFATKPQFDWNRSDKN